MWLPRSGCLFTVRPYAFRSRASTPRHPRRTPKHLQHPRHRWREARAACPVESGVPWYGDQHHPILSGDPVVVAFDTTSRVTLKTEKKRIKRNGASKSISPISVSFRFVSRGGHRVGIGLVFVSFRFREVGIGVVLCFVSVSFRFVSRGEHRARFLFRFVPRSFSALR